MNNMTITDDTLTLYYYDDGLTVEERRTVASALAEHPHLAERYSQLSYELNGIPTQVPPALPADMMQRFHDSIERVSALEINAIPQRQQPARFWSFFWGIAVTAALALGIGIGTWFGGTLTTQPDGSDRSAVVSRTQHATVPARFVRSVQLHFRESELELNTLALDSDADRIFLILNLIEQNRLFAQAAVNNRAPDLARVLRAFEPILLQLAAEDLALADAEALRAQLAFELSVMLTKLAREPSDQLETT